MAHPFGGHPRFSFLLQYLLGFGCTHREMKLTRSDGERAKIQVFEREVDGVLLRATVHLNAADPPLSPSVVRSICERLGVPPEFVERRIH